MRRDARDLLHPPAGQVVQESPGIGGEGSHLASLVFAAYGVKGERRFTRAANPTHYDVAKCVDKLNNAHKKQLLTYLGLTGMHLGYLLNFSESLMNNGIHRMVNRLVESIP